MLPSRAAPSAVYIAPRVLLHPVGSRPPEAGADVIGLPTLPSRAFGDGSHPSTRLCARGVDLACRQRLPGAVLDVGTGTGVLARLARAHGVPFVVATDIEPEALRAAQAHAALDERTGELLITSAAPDAWGPRFDLVVANILEEVLIALAPSLAAALAPGGALLLSGFMPAQTPALRAAFGALGLEVGLQARLEGWALLELRRASGRGAGG